MLSSSKRFNTCSSCEEQPEAFAACFSMICFNTCSSCEEQLALRFSRHATPPFQYMLLLRGATQPLELCLLYYWVSIHAPLARSNGHTFNADGGGSVSIHAPLARSNTPRIRLLLPRNRFNTCSSCEEQLSEIEPFPCAVLFQYMLLLRGATVVRIGNKRFPGVSIHAPLARSNIVGSSGTHFFNVSIHAPLARSNLARGYVGNKPEFQYMLLLRGATRYATSSMPSTGFNTCSSCEEQLHHLPRLLHHRRFNTCSSCEEQRYSNIGNEDVPEVSIHAPLARSNANRVLHAAIGSSFNTCSSCEEQRPDKNDNWQALAFQYMLLLRGATLPDGWTIWE